MSGLSANVSTGDVGKPIRVSPALTLAGTDPRFYFDAVPAGSALLALSSFTGLPQDLSQWRLPVGPGGATFTPDVPGRYDVRLRDVTVTTLLPHYGGQVFTDGFGNPIGPTDNEVQSPAYGGGAAAAEYTVTVWVAETITRQIGFGQDKATLSIRLFNEQVDNLNPGVATVTLTKPSTPAATVAAVDATLQQVLVALQSETSVSAFLHLLPFYFYVLAGDWNVHLGLGTTSVHANSDGTNVLLAPSLACSDLPTAIAALTDMAAKYNLHRANTGGGWHSTPDATNVPGTPGATLATAIAFYNLLHTTFDTHGTSVVFCGPAADGAAGEWLETPVTLADLVRLTNKMTNAYEVHRVKTTQTAHGTVDASNTFTFTMPTTIGHLCDGVNRLADSMNQHAQNLASTASGGAAVAYHAGKSTRIVLNRAADARTAAITLEECWLAYERHLLDGGAVAGGLGAHASQALGYLRIRYPLNADGSGGNSRWPWMARIQKAFRAALDSTAPMMPPNVNTGSANAVLTFGWTRA